MKPLQSVQISWFIHVHILYYSKTGLKRPLKKKTKIGFQDRLSLNAGQKYCRYAILLTFIKLPFVIKICVLSIFKWPLKTGFTVFTSGSRDVLQRLLILALVAFVIGLFLSSINFFFKRHLLLNHWFKFKIISQE